MKIKFYVIKINKVYNSETTREINYKLWAKKNLNPYHCIVVVYNYINIDVEETQISSPLEENPLQITTLFHIVFKFNLRANRLLPYSNLN